MTNKQRCAWVSSDPLYIDYHDNEWGRPLHDNEKLFELLTLEGAQAGLSWITVLKRREGYRQCFADFNLDQIARFNDRTIATLLQDNRIIRNRLKVESTISNAKATLTLRDQGTELNDFFWRYVDHKPIINHWLCLQQVPSNTPLSDQIAKDLKKLGFRFVGTTIIYAFMQAIGMVNDHTTDCFLHAASSH